MSFHSFAESFQEFWKNDDRDDTEGTNAMFHSSQRNIM
jgi:hypothetical protein